MKRYYLALRPTIVDLGEIAGVVRLDCGSDRTHFHGVVTGDVDDIVVEGTARGQYHEFTLELRYAVEGRFRTSWLWSGGISPLLATAGGQTNIIVGFTRDGGETVYAFLAGWGMA